MLLLNYSIYSQKMGWCEREIIEVTERGKRWRRLPQRSLTLLLHCPPVIFISHYGWSTEVLLIIWISGKNSRNITGIFSSNVIFTIFRICPLVHSFHIYQRLVMIWRWGSHCGLEDSDEEISATWIVPQGRGLGGHRGRTETQLLSV